MSFFPIWEVLVLDFLNLQLNSPTKWPQNGPPNCHKEHSDASGLGKGLATQAFVLMVPCTTLNGLVSNGMELL